MVARDTTPAAAAAQDAAYRRLGPAGRLHVALELSDLVRSLALAGMRRRHPDRSEEQLVEALARELYTHPGQ